MGPIFVFSAIFLRFDSIIEIDHMHRFDFAYDDLSVVCGGMGAQFFIIIIFLTFRIGMLKKQ